VVSWFKGFLSRRSCFGAWLFPLTSSIHAAQRDLQKLTVGYTPIAGASLPFFIAVEEKIFQKYGYEISPVFMGGSPLINSAILAGEFPLGYTGGGAVISSRLSGSDLIAIASPLPVLTIDGWSKPEIKSINDFAGQKSRSNAIRRLELFLGVVDAGVRRGETQRGDLYSKRRRWRVLRSPNRRPGGCLHDRISFGLNAKNAGFNLLFRPSQTEYGLFPPRSLPRASRG